MHYALEFLDYCKSLSFTLTSLRKAVLHVLWQADKPLKAYDILEQLKENQPNLTAATIYRTLSFFMSSGITHKIDSIQSYVLCAEASGCSEVLMVCSLCHTVREVHGRVVRDAATSLAHLDAFQLHPTPIELQGVCSHCSDKAV